MVGSMDKGKGTWKMLKTCTKDGCMACSLSVC